MAGYTAIYCVGRAGGYEGADGINSILFQIWQGDGNRRWLEVHYFDNSIQPIGNIRNIVPEAPDSPTMLLDACLAFFPRHFEACPSLPQVQDELRNVQHIDFGEDDFDKDASDLPPMWNRLRAEAAPLMAGLFILKGELHPVDFHAASHVADASITNDLSVRHPEPAPHVESLHAPDNIGNDANMELFGDHDKGEDVGPVG